MPAVTKVNVLFPLTCDRNRSLPPVRGEAVCEADAEPRHPSGVIVAAACNELTAG